MSKEIMLMSIRLASQAENSAFQALVLAAGCADGPTTAVDVMRLLSNVYIFNHFPFLPTTLMLAQATGRIAADTGHNCR